MPFGDVATMGTAYLGALRDARSQIALQITGFRRACQERGIAPHPVTVPVAKHVTYTLGVDGRLRNSDGRLVLIDQCYLLARLNELVVALSHLTRPEALDALAHQSNA